MTPGLLGATTATLLETRRSLVGQIEPKDLVHVIKPAGVDTWVRVASGSLHS